MPKKAPHPHTKLIRVSNDADADIGKLAAILSDQHARTVSKREAADYAATVALAIAKTGTARLLFTAAT